MCTSLCRYDQILELWKRSVKHLIILNYSTCSKLDMCAYDMSRKDISIECILSNYIICKIYVSKDLNFKISPILICRFYLVCIERNYTCTYTQGENQAAFETLEYLNGSENSLADYLVKKKIKILLLTSFLYFNLWK